VPVLILPGESVTVTEHVPGADLDVTQDLGRRGTAEISLQVVIPAAGWTAFVALNGQRATLALIANPTRQAKLSLGQDFRYFVEGFYKGTLKFLVG